jgi:hypothetical protein
MLDAEEQFMAMAGEEGLFNPFRVEGDQIRNLTQGGAQSRLPWAIIFHAVGVERSLA